MIRSYCAGLLVAFCSCRLLRYHLLVKELEQVKRERDKMADQLTVTGTAERTTVFCLAQRQSSACCCVTFLLPYFLPSLPSSLPSTFPSSHPHSLLLFLSLSLSPSSLSSPFHSPHLPLPQEQSFQEIAKEVSYQLLIKFFYFFLHKIFFQYEAMEPLMFVMVCGFGCYVY